MKTRTILSTTGLLLAIPLASFFLAGRRTHIPSLPVIEEVRSQYGLYLSSIIANSNNDFFYLVGNYNDAVRGKGGNDFLGRLYIISDLGGKREEALEAAWVAKAAENAAASIYITSREMIDGNISEALKVIGSVEPGIVRDIFQAWVLLAGNQKNVATDSLARHISPRNRSSVVPALIALGGIYSQIGDISNAEIIYNTASSHKLGITDLEHMAAFYDLSGNGKGLDFLKSYSERFPLSSLGDLIYWIENRKYKPVLIDTPDRGFATALLKITDSILDTNDESLYDSAFLYANQALLLWPELHAARISRARIFLALGRDDDFLAELARIPNGSFLQNTSRLMLADYYSDSGDIRQARLLYNAVISDNPGALQAYMSLGRMLFSNNNNRDAIRIFSKGAARSDNRFLRSRFFYFRGIAHEHNGDFESALADLSNAVELDPSEPSILNSYGYFLVDRKIDIEKGMRYIEKALRTDRENANFIDSYGWALFRQGNLEDAALVLQYARLLNPTSAVISDHLATVYWAQGRKNEAKFEWSKALNNLRDEDRFENLTREILKYRLNNGFDGSVIARGK